MRRGPPFRMLAMPVAIQWPWNFAQALLWVEGLGFSREACSALSCSYWTRAATRCLTALSMCLGVARFASFFFFKYMPRQRAGRRPPWAQIASLARPEPWRRRGVHLYPLGLPLSLGPFCRSVAAAVAAAVRFQHGAPFLPPLRAFGPRENRHCKKCAKFGVFGMWHAV